MRIGILTFHRAVNYGAVLQAYGMQEYLRSLGHDVDVIDYCPSYIESYYKAYHRNETEGSSIPERLRIRLRECLVVPIRMRRNYLFRRFCRRKLHLNDLDLASPINDYDAFVIGSDQIWNPSLTDGLDSVYLGRFAAASGKKVVFYAASAGSVEHICRSGEEEKFLSGLKLSGGRVSVREKALADYIENHTDITADVVIDPVLLAGDVMYRKIAVKPKERRPYLLLFQLLPDDDVIRYAEKAATKDGLELVVVISSKEMLRSGGMHQCLSPEQFVGYFMQASYVMTTSFHGTVFSILFEKNFNVVNTGETNCERMVYLLDLLGLSNRLCTLDAMPDMTIIDYKPVMQELRSLRRASENFLSENLLPAGHHVSHSDD